MDLCASPLFLLLSTTKIPKQKPKKNLNSEEKVGQQGTLEPKEDGDEIPEFSVSCIPVLALKN